MRQPVALALAQPTLTVPGGGSWSYEPKYDGWRGCVHTRQGLLHSRAGTPLNTRFPEIVAACRQLGDAVVDGELVALRGGTLDFAALQTSPARRHAEVVTVYFMVFDLLAAGGDDLRGMPYMQRRTLLTELLDAHLSGGLVQRVPSTRDRDTGLEWMQPDYGEVGIEGVVAKPVGSTYRAGRRSGWVKVRHQHTADAVILGVAAGNALVLGHPTRRGGWRAVGVSQPINQTLAQELATLLHASGDSAQLPGTIAGLPGTDSVHYLPVHPDVVVEIGVDGAYEYGRYRHRPQIHRLRGDLTAGDLAAPPPAQASTPR